MRKRPRHVGATRGYSPLSLVRGTWRGRVLCRVGRGSGRGCASPHTPTTLFERSRNEAFSFVMDFFGRGHCTARSTPPSATSIMVLLFFSATALARQGAGGVTSLVISRSRMPYFVDSADSPKDYPQRLMASETDNVEFGIDLMGSTQNSRPSPYGNALHYAKLSRHAQLAPEQNSYHLIGFIAPSSPSSSPAPSSAYFRKLEKPAPPLLRPP